MKNTLLAPLFMLTVAFAFAPAHNSFAQATTTEITEMPKGDYKVDPSHTTVLFKVSHMGFAEYIGRFNAFEGTLNFNPDDIKKTAIEVVIDAASIDVNHEELEEKLRAEDAFNVGLYPQIKFAASHVDWTGDNTAKITGNLKMLGETHPLTFDASFVGGGVHPFSQRYTMGFHAKAVLDRTKWGLNTWVPMVGEDVTLEIHSEFNSLQKAGD